MTPDTLTEIYIRTARSGNTSMAIDIARQIGATVIVHDAREEARLKGLGARAVSVERGVEAFFGTNGPYIVDLPVVSRAAQGWRFDRMRANEAERERDEQRARAEGAEREGERYRREASAEIMRLQRELTAAQGAS